MTNSKKTKTGFMHQFWKRTLCLLLATITVVGLLPLQNAFAADIWDGVGGGGNGNGSAVSGGFDIESTNAYYSIFGFRFTVYNAAGERAGRTIDIDVRTASSTVYRTAGEDMKSHIDLNREYQDYLAKGKAPLYAPALTSNNGRFYKTSECSEAIGRYLDTSLNYLRQSSGDGPSQIGEWLKENNSLNAQVVAQRCGVVDYDPFTHYIIVEPMYRVRLNSTYYAMTMAELAVYQAATVEAAQKASGYATSKINGWTSVVPFGYQINLYVNNIGHYTSATFGRWLYAEGDYEGTLGTKKVEASFLTTSSKTGPTMKLPHAAVNSSTGTIRNTAEDVLLYQVGMGIFTHIPAEDDFIVTVDPGGDEIGGKWLPGSWVPPDSSWQRKVDENGKVTYSKAIKKGSTTTIPDAVLNSGIEGLDYTFSGWNINNSTCSMAGQTYTQGEGNCTLTAVYSEADNRKEYWVYLSYYSGIKSVVGEGKYKPGDLVTISAETLNQHYAFQKWQSSFSGANSREQEFTFVMPAQNVTVFAHAEHKKYTITYLDASGNEIGKQNYTYWDSDVTLMENSTAKSGYAFTGWQVVSTPAPDYTDPSNGKTYTNQWGVKTKYSSMERIPSMYQKYWGDIILQEYWGNDQGLVVHHWATSMTGYLDTDHEIYTEFYDAEALRAAGFSFGVSYLATKLFPVDTSGGYYLGDAYLDYVYNHSAEKEQGSKVTYIFLSSKTANVYHYYNPVAMLHFSYGAATLLDFSFETAAPGDMGGVPDTTSPFLSQDMAIYLMKDMLAYASKLNQSYTVVIDYAFNDDNTELTLTFTINYHVIVAGMSDTVTLKLGYPDSVQTISFYLSDQDDEMSWSATGTDSGQLTFRIREGDGQHNTLHMQYIYSTPNNAPSITLDANGGYFEECYDFIPDQLFIDSANNKFYSALDPNGTRFVEYGSETSLYLDPGHFPVRPGYSFVGYVDTFVANRSVTDKYGRIMIAPNSYTTNSIWTAMWAAELEIIHVIRKQDGTEEIYKIEYDIASFDYNLLYKSYSTVIPGYAFVGGKPSDNEMGMNVYEYVVGTFMVKDSTNFTGASITLYYEADSNIEVDYVINHWGQNIGGTNYDELLDSVTGTGGVEDTIVGEILNFTGFTSPTVRIEIILDPLNPDNNVINYYYTRNKYTVTLSKGTGVSTVTSSGATSGSYTGTSARSYWYGEQVTISATLTSTSNYRWNNWTGYRAYPDQTTTFTMPAENISFKANATGKVSYKVIHHKLDVDGNVVYTSSATTKSDFAGNEVDVTTLQTSYSGYVYDRAEIDEVPQETFIVAANAEVHLYYTPISYQVRYNANGGTGTMSNSTHIYDVAKTLNANMFTKSGYQFAGWVLQEATVTTSGKLNVRSGPNITYTAVTQLSSGAVVQILETTKTGSNTWARVAQSGAEIGWICLTGYTSTAIPTTVTYANMASVKNLAKSDGAVVNLYAVWTETVPQYSFTVDPNGGEWLSYTSPITFPMEYGYTGWLEYPSREGYTFIGWDLQMTTDYGEDSVVWYEESDGYFYYTQGAGDCTLTAVWAKNYTLTVNPNGGSWNGVADKTVFEFYYGFFGYFSSIPTRTGYVFAGWDLTMDTLETGGQYSEVWYDDTDGMYHYYQGQGNCTLTAKWTPIQYTITWKDGNGATLKSEKWNYGSMPSYSGTTPTKTATAQYTYTFNGKWSPTIVTVTGDATYTAQFDSVQRTYTITCDMQGGSGGTAKFYEMYNVRFYTTSSSTAATKITVPTRTGYVFGGYYTSTNGGGTQIVDASGNIKVANTYFTANATIYAYWTHGNTKYTVNHYQMGLDGKYPTTATETQSFTGTTGDTLTLANLAKTYTGFTYAYGQVGGTTVTTTTILADGSCVINLYYSRNQYTVTLNKGTGIASVTGAGTYYYGASVTIDATVSTGYTWSKWSDTHSTTTKKYTFTMPAANVTDTANATINQYTVTWVDGNGDTLKTEKLDYGTMPSYSGATPTKTVTAQYTYTFNNKWSPTIVAVTKDATYTAQFDATANKYTVTYKVDGATYATETYTYGTSVTVKAAPTKPGCSFSGWSTSDVTISNGKFTMPAKNVTISGTFTAKSYTLLVNPNGGSWNSSTSNSSFMLSYGATKTIATPVWEGHTFSGWTITMASGSETKSSMNGTTYTQGTGNCTLTAQWDTDSFTLTINPNGGSWNGSTNNSAFTLDYGATKSIANPTRTGYTFKGWTVSNSNCSMSGTTYTQGVGDCTLTAQWEINTYTVTWKHPNGTILETDTNVPYGTTPTYNGATPTKAATAQYTYTHSGWTPTISPVTGDVTYTATFSQTVNKYTITWVDGDGKTLKTEKLYYGTMPFYSGATPTKTATAQYTYTFNNKWSPTIDAVMKDTTYTAQFDATAIIYKITYDEAGGSTVSDLIYTCETDVTLAAAPTRTGYTFKGWKLATAAGNWSATTYDANQAIGTGKYGNITLVAQWTPISYEVKYNANGGTGSMSNSIHTYDVAKNLTSNAFTRLGYDFIGWATSPDSTTVVYTDGVSVKNLVTTNGAIVNLYAVWKSKTYTVTINHILSNGTTNGYTFDATTHTVTYNDIFTLDASVAVTLPNGTALSKFTSSSLTGTTTNYEIGSSFTQPAKNLTFNCYYVPVNYSISYQLNGGTNYSGAPTSYNVLSGLMFGTPSRKGYTFAGWYSANVVTTKTLTISAQSSNYNFGAVYSNVVPGETYWITMDMAKLTSGTATRFTTLIYDFTDSKQLAISTNNFGGNVGFSITCPSSADATHNIQIIIYAGVAGSTSGVTAKYTNVKVTTDAAKITGINAGTDYTTNSAFTSGSDMYSKLAAQQTGNVTLIATWTPITYEVKYNANSGTGTMSNSTHTYDVAKALTANAFTKTGYIFAGWATSASGSVVYTNSQTVTNLASTQGAVINLYAVWTPATYEVEYNANGGTGSMSNSIHTYNVAQNLTANVFTRTGYTFAGWATSASGSVVYTDGQSVLNLASTQGAVVKLYAVWTPISYNIQYNLGVGSGPAGTAGAKTPTTATYDQWFEVSMPSRNGYMFAGWQITGMGASGVTHYYGCSSFDYKTTTNGSVTTDILADFFKNLHSVNDATVTFTAVWVPVDVAITQIVLKDSAGNVLDPDNIPFGTKVFVYHTYKNNSDTPVVVNGYSDSKSMILHEGSTEITILAGGTVTVIAEARTPEIGEGRVCGYVYVDGFDFGTGPDGIDLDNNAMSDGRELDYVVRFDLEVYEIYVTYAGTNTRIDRSWIELGAAIDIHVVYRNNSNGAIPVDFYFGINTNAPGNKWGSVTLAANSRSDIVVRSNCIPAKGELNLVAGIYRSGMTATTEAYETNLANNEKMLAKLVVQPSLDLVDPGVDLRANRETITSFIITNNNDYVYKPGQSLTLVMYVYDGYGNLLLTMDQQVYVPEQETQLAWFRWTVPAAVGPLTIRGELKDTAYDILFYECQGERRVITSTIQNPPDTSYEPDKPDDWAQPSKPSAQKDFANWSVWEYDAQTDSFTEKTYGLTVKPGTVTITPNSLTAYTVNGIWVMKSGYGFALEAADPIFSALDGCILPDSDDYTNPQWSFATFPEFEYSREVQATLEQVDGQWMLSYQDEYGRQHFVPIWYPDTVYDGDAYYVTVIMTEIWTPVGVLTVYIISNPIYIEGDMYDDWH